MLGYVVFVGCRLTEGVAEGVADFVGLRLTVGVAEGLALSVGIADFVGLRLTVGVAEGLALSVGVADCVGLSDDDAISSSSVATTKPNLLVLIPVMIISIVGTTRSSDENFLVVTIVDVLY